MAWDCRVSESAVDETVASVAAVACQMRRTNWTMN